MSTPHQANFRKAAVARPFSFFVYGRPLGPAFLIFCTRLGRFDPADRAPKREVELKNEIERIQYFAKRNAHQPPALTRKGVRTPWSAPDAPSGPQLPTISTLCETKSAHRPET